MSGNRVPLLSEEKGGIGSIGIPPDYVKPNLSTILQDGQGLQSHSNLSLAT